MAPQAQSHRGSELPLEAQRLLLTGYRVNNLKKYQSAIMENTVNSATDDLFAMAGASEVDYNKAYEKNVLETPLIWGTENYASQGAGHGFGDPVGDISLIKPRTEKPREEQRRRVREKAEVFTPSWVCNLQNNLVDDALLGKNAFTTSLVRISGAGSPRSGWSSPRSTPGGATWGLAAWRCAAARAPISSPPMTPPRGRRFR